MLLLMPVAGLFRAGNASPMGNLAGLMKRVLSAMRGMKVRFRSDSAGFQAKVVRVLRAAGVDYTITARKDAAVMEAIRSIPAGNRNGMRVGRGRIGKRSWQRLTIKTVRFRLIRLAGVVVRRSRSVWLKLSGGYLYRKEFEDARERILGLCGTLSYG